MIVATTGQNVHGNATNPRLGANIENGRAMPRRQITIVVTTSGQLAQLWINGI
jgi:hypothetical protein